MGSEPTSGARAGWWSRPIVVAPSLWRALQTEVRALLQDDDRVRTLRRFLHDQFQQDPRPPLVQILRKNIASRVRPTEEEAFSYLLITLARAAVEGHDRESALRGFERLGAAGAELARMMRNIFNAPRRGVIAETALASLRELIEPALAVPDRGLLDLLPLAPERALPGDAAVLLDASPEPRSPELRSPELRSPEPRSPEPRSPEPRSPESDRVQRLLPIASIRDANRSLSLPDLSLQLGYGAGDLYDAIRTELTAHPESLLSKSLRAGLEPLGDAPTDAECAAMVVKWLWSLRASGQTDQIRLGAALASYGEAARPILAELERLATREFTPRANFELLADIVRAIARETPPKLARAIIDGLVRHDALLPKSIPAVDAVARALPKDAVKGHGLLAAQHLFPVLVPWLEALIDKGMDPRDIHVLGTDYTPNPLVEAYCEFRGMDVRAGRDLRGGSRAFAEHRQQEIDVFLRSIRASGVPVPPRGFKICDDGGHLHQALMDGPSHGFEPELGAYFLSGEPSGAEQTTRGLTELGLLPRGLTYDVVRVGDCVPKKTLESPMIGWALAASSYHELLQMGALDEIERIAVVSAGAVGLEAAKALSPIRPTVVVDTDAAKREAAERSGFKAHASLGGACREVQFALSCTGFRAEDRHVLDGFRGALASGSSAAIELDLEELEAFGRVRCLNHGRPVNFKHDGFAVLSKEQIGLTRALLFAAIAQPKAETEEHWAKVDPRLEAIAVEAWKASGGEKLGPIEEAYGRGPRPPRPDSLSARGTASESEWLTFLRAHRGRVLPPPSQSAGSCFVFEDLDGGARFVDVRRGVSVTLALDRMPEQLFEAPEGVLLTGADASGAWIRSLRPDAGPSGWRVGDRLGGGPMVAATLGSAERTAVAGGDQRGYLFDRGDRLLAFPPGLWEAPREIIKKDRGSRFFAWVDGATIAEVLGPPARLYTHTAVERPFYRAGEELPLPGVIAQIDGVARSFFPRTPWLIGQTRDGATALVELTIYGSERPGLVLPQGARYRGVSYPDPKAPLDPVVQFVMPGEPDELAHYRSIRLDTALIRANRALGHSSDAR